MRRQDTILRIVIGIVGSIMLIIASAAYTKNLVYAAEINVTENTSENSENNNAVVETELPYEISGSVITLKVEKNAEIKNDINNAILYAGELYKKDKKIYTVKVPAGKYTINGTIKFYGNIILDFQGVTLEYTKSTGNMLILGDSTINTDPNYMSGYGKLRNITINGGTFVGNSKCSSTMLKIAHSKNVTLSGCEFVGGGCTHQLEIAAVDGFTLKDCTFRDMVGSGTSGKQEAVQFDMPCSESVYKGTYQDGTPMKNVKVTGCTFKNLSRGIGTHNELLGAYHKNIVISDNYFENVSGECIVALDYYNCEISGNTIKKCGAGIIFQSFKNSLTSVYTTIHTGEETYSGTFKHNLNSVIKDNNIDIVYNKSADIVAGIRVFGYNLEKGTKKGGAEKNNVINAGNYYVSGITIKNNIITTERQGIELHDAQNCKVVGNVIRSKTNKVENNGILAAFASLKIDISETIITDFGSCSILISEKSSATRIYKNIIKRSAFQGISVHNNSSVTGYISENIISDMKGTAISIYAGSSVYAVVNNNIKNSTAMGIAATASSKIKKKISDNTITDIKKNAIYLDSLEGQLVITRNIIKRCTSESVFLYYVSGNTKINITENTIVGNKKKALIYVYAGNVTVKDNILKSGFTPVYIHFGAKGTIGLNTLSGNKHGYTVETSYNTKQYISDKYTVEGLKCTVKKGGTVILNWKKMNKAAAYIVEYSTKKSFATSTKKTIYSGTKKTIKNLTKGKKYYFRVQIVRVAGNTKIYQNYSNVLAKKAK